MSFVKAVNEIPAISKYLKKGLQAMGANSALVRPSEPQKCDGSVDIDACFMVSQPNASRWDYAIGYDGQAYFVEVHPASGQVSDVIAKSVWLREWLKAGGAPLAAIHADDVFHWLSTGRVSIISKEKRRLAKNKILINTFKLK